MSPHAVVGSRGTDYCWSEPKGSPASQRPLPNFTNKEIEAHRGNMTCINLTESPLSATLSTLRKRDTEKSLVRSHFVVKPQNLAATKASWLQRQAPCHQQYSLI